MGARHFIVISTLAAAAAAFGVYRYDPGLLASTYGLSQSGGANAATLAANAGPRATTIRAATARQAPFPIERTSVGVLSSPAVVAVNTRLSSQVTAIAVKDGQSVREGDLLFRLDDRAVRAQLAKDEATLAKDQAALEEGKSDLQRGADLLKKGITTQQAYDAQAATVDGLQATVQADRAAIDGDQVQLGYATITAPISGRLGQINTTVGNLVTTSSSSSTATAAMVTITQMDPLRVSFSLPETDLALLQQALVKGEPDAVTVTARDGGTPIASGGLDFIDSSVDTASGTILARATLCNGKGVLWPGQYVAVTVRLGVLPDSVAIPTVAVQQGQDGAFVYVVGADSTAHMRPVVVAGGNGDTSALRSGLAVGEKVVVEGQGRLKDGAQVREEGVPGGAAKRGGGATPSANGAQS